MPLCPPAKRDWTKMCELEIHSAVMKWPPKDYLQLTQDSRLLAFEYIAMFVEHQSKKRFPCIERSLLHHKYNFLSLKGMGKLHNTSSEKSAAAIRKANFKYVTDIAKGKFTCPIMAEAVLTNLEGFADRCRDTDSLTQLMDTAGIKILI